MSTNKTNRNQLIIKVGLLILTTVVLIAFAGTSAIGTSTRQKDRVAFTRPGLTAQGQTESGQNIKHSPDAKQRYVPGEVVIKLKSGQTEGVSLSSYGSASLSQNELFQPDSVKKMVYNAALHRLQSEYELQDGVLIFKSAP